MITVGDQIFALNQEIKKLKEQCRRYETALQDIAAGNGNTSTHTNFATAAKKALDQTAAVPSTAGVS